MRAHPRELLQAYLDRELAMPDANRVEQHLQACDECRRELEALKADDRLLSAYYAPAIAPATDLVARTVARLRSAPRQPERRPIGPRLALVGALAAATLLAWALLLRPFRNVPSTQVARAPWGSIVSVTGGPSVGGPGRWHRLTRSRGVRPGDLVRTSDVDRLSVRFGDGTIVELGFGAQAAFMPGPARPSAIRIDYGTARIKARPGDGALAVYSPSATAAVTGTDFVIRAEPDRSTLLSVLRGAVSFRSAGAAVAVPAGYSSVARPGLAPSPPLPRVFLQIRPPGGLVTVRWVGAAADRRIFLARLFAGRLNCGFLYRPLFAAERTGLGSPGVLVTRVRSGSPAERGGLRQGDVITAIGGLPVRDAADARTILSQAVPWSPLPVTALRRGAPTRIVLPPDDRYGPPEPRPPALADANRLAVDGKLAQAEAVLRRIVSEEANCAAAHNNLGALLERRGDLPAALREYLQAAALQPGCALYRYNSASLLAAAGNLEQAVREYQRASGLSRWWASPALGRARALLFLGRPAEAGAALTAAEARAAADPEVQMGRAEFLLAEGRARQALPHARRATASGAPEAFLLQGILEDATSNPRGAVLAIQRGLGIAPNDPDLLDALGTAWRHAGDPVRSAKAYQAALAVAPTRTGTRANLASLLLAAGDLGGALAQARTAALQEAMNGLSDGPGQQVYASIALARANMPGVEDGLRALRSVDRDSVSTAVALSLLAARRGDLRASRMLWTEARRLSATEAERQRRLLTAAGDSRGV